jgi:hypothetical protein
VKLKFGVDAISTASDSCAMPRRHERSLRRIGRRHAQMRDTKVTGGAEFSRELFYQATTVLASVSRDLNNANTTVAGGFAFSLNQPQLHPGPTVESQQSYDAYASVTQSWTKRTVTQVGYEINQVNAQTKPFLRAKLNGVMTVGNSPDARTRHALSARLRQALPADTFFEADYRRYHDSWSLDSNAVSLGLSHHFGPRIVGGGSWRHYSQTPTSRTPARPPLHR